MFPNSAANLAIWATSSTSSVSPGTSTNLSQTGRRRADKRRANAISPYLQEIWKISELLQMNAGLRLDTYTLVGDSVEFQLSPKIGGSYQPWFGTIFHFSVGRGFRAAVRLDASDQAERHAAKSR